MIRVTDKQFFMHQYLKSNLDSMVYDMNKGDWSFVVVITGDGKVRVGKSVLGQQIAYYLAQMTKRPWHHDTAWNICFSGDELMEKGVNNSQQILVYDEGREGLETTKTMHKANKALRDYFAETGMMNHITIVILPDFFELSKGLATTQSECLVNVFVKKERKNSPEGEVLSRTRGFFEYFGETKKSLLYHLGKDKRNYAAVHRNFWGNFPNVWTVDREAYEKKKLDFLRRERNADEAPNRYKLQRDIILRYLYKERVFNQSELSRIFDNAGVSLSQKQISNIVAEHPILVYRN